MFSPLPNASPAFNSALELARLCQEAIEAEEAWTQATLVTIEAHNVMILARERYLECLKPSPTQDAPK